MRNQRSLLLVLAPILGLLTASGCRNSTKTASPAPTPSPTPAVTMQPAQPVVTPTPPPARTVLAIPIQVKVPASFSTEQLPDDKPAQFLVDGNAGEFLFVKAAGKQRELPSDSVTVRLEGTDAEPLETTVNDYTGNFVYALAKTGVYQVDFDSGGREANISFAFLDHNDPMVSPGISPDQISIDLGPFAKDGLAVAPYALLPDYGYLSSWPTHLAAEGKNFEFRIMTVAGFLQVFHDQRVETLAKAISTKGKDIKVLDLPYALEERWCAYVTTMRWDVLEGQGWRGLRWIGGFGGSGDAAYPTCGLGYVFAGISNDGRYLIILRSDISHPDEKRLMPPRTLQGTPPHTWEVADYEKDVPARKKLEKSITTADPASFTPNLDQLDAVIKSLKLKSSNEAAQADK